MNQEKAQRLWEQNRMSRQRGEEKCQRCGHSRNFHNRGNRYDDSSICRQFLEIGEVVPVGTQE